ncbi:MAG: type II toxin-antitoxin system RelE/ParE family toxin [Cellulomonas sp.]|jgi:plasmid stabilization system protein ParE|nr:type II toxin-antitoxin system RelE/ParE family toxin [Cellulomonas sp.]
MSRRLRVHPDLLADVAEALDYYRQVDPALAARFFNSYTQGLRWIRGNPLAAREYVPGFRRVVLVPFPYLVAFAVDDEHVHVAALLHTRRDPQTNRTVLERRS